MPHLNKFNLRVADLALTEEESSRYSLAAIQVTPNGTVATDGHRLMRISLPATGAEQEDVLAAEAAADDLELLELEATETFESFLLPTRMAKALYSALSKSRRKGLLTAVIGKLTGKRRTKPQTVIHVGDGHTLCQQVFHVPPDRGQFPKWEAIRAACDPIIEVDVRAKYLLDAARIITDFVKPIIDGSTRIQAVRLSVSGPNKPMRLTASNQDTGQELEAYIMPLRLDDPSANKFALAEAEIERLKKQLDSQKAEIEKLKAAAKQPNLAPV